MGGGGGRGKEEGEVWGGNNREALFGSMKILCKNDEDGR